MNTYNINRRCLIPGYNHGQVNCTNFNTNYQRSRGFRRNSTGYSSGNSERSVGSDYSFDSTSYQSSPISLEREILKKDAVFEILDEVFENLGERWELSRKAFEIDCQTLEDWEIEKKNEKPRKTAGRYSPFDQKKTARKSLIPNRRSFLKQKN